MKCWTDDHPRSLPTWAVPWFYDLYAHVPEHAGFPIFLAPCYEIALHVGAKNIFFRDFRRSGKPQEESAETNGEGFTDCSRHGQSLRPPQHSFQTLTGDMRRALGKIFKPQSTCRVVESLLSHLHSAGTLRDSSSELTGTRERRPGLTLYYKWWQLLQEGWTQFTKMWINEIQYNTRL